ncbi:MAG: FAD:protein FMN transferase [Pelagimonas sp.]|jgi:thiamine biosynthesis lipoprotein|nr:FAD:protein FMN transferase [Pelagimonas sp.]
MLNRRRFLSLSASFACLPQWAQASEWRGIALGAEVSISLYGPKEITQPALTSIPAQLRKIEALFSLYDPSSALVQLNQNKTLLAPDPAFVALASDITQIHEKTDGQFDPSVQSMWESAPEETPATSWKDVAISHAQIALAPHQSLTFNGIAQGWATDHISGMLHELGFAKALVNIGEHRALGGPFRLGLSDPRHGHVGQVSVAGSAIATSSPKASQISGRDHIVSPTHRPALWSSISIEAPNAMLADALSTAAVFMPPARLARLKSDFDLRRIIAIAPNGDLRSI